MTRVCAVSHPFTPYVYQARYLFTASNDEGLRGFYPFTAPRD